MTIKTMTINCPVCMYPMVVDFTLTEQAEIGCPSCYTGLVIRLLKHANATSISITQTIQGKHGT